jgi:hypothetical protein
MSRTSSQNVRPCTVQIDNAPKVHFSATLGGEPEVEVVLV